MTAAVLYRWKLKPGREAEFRKAWAEGTRLIHTHCGSFGANLHSDADGLVWSYAYWPSEAARQACFKETDWFSQPAFQTMQACIAERFEEIPLDVLEAEIRPATSAHDTATLMTQRLVLRPLRLSDAEALFPAVSDEASMRYWSRGAFSELAEFQAYLSWNAAQTGARCWALIRLGAAEDALGWVILIDERPDCYELGYILRPDAQGAGLAAEAAHEACRHGFEELGARRIFADVDPDNLPSIKLLEKLGFEQEGRFRKAWKTHIGERDSLIYGRVR